MKRLVRPTEERGFTMIELMVVVLLIGILVGIGLPTRLGARIRAQDRAAQADIRNAFTAERAYFTDTLTYTTDASAMTAIEAAIAYVAGDTPLSVGVVYLHFHAGPNEIFISTRSSSGTCFYLREADGGGATFAGASGCGSTDTQTYGPTW